VNTVEQGSPEHIMACENVIVRCPLGFRDDRPDFGWPWPEFRTAPLDLSGLENALQTFEPRSTVTAREVADMADAAIRDVEVDVEVD
jgi:phage baseplate assembly protein W